MYYVIIAFSPIILNGLFAHSMTSQLKQKLAAYLLILRPFSWVKSVFILAPLFFAHQFFDAVQLWRVGVTVGVFFLFQSAVYVVNDWVDRESDRLHSTKKHRPFAAGTMSGHDAFLVLLITLGGGTLLMLTFVPHIIVVVGMYLLLNVFYSLYLKHIAVIEIFVVATFYLLRVITGCYAVQVPISPWMLLCTFFLALFLVIAKRRGEFLETHGRRVLKQYTPALLDAFLIIALTLTLITYSLYVVFVVKNTLALLSILFVMATLFRYLQRFYSNPIQAQNPESLIARDSVMMVTTFFWLVLMVCVFYFKIDFITI